MSGAKKIAYEYCQSAKEKSESKMQEKNGKQK